MLEVVGATVQQSGGALLFLTANDFINGSVVNSSFVNCSAGSFGGAIYIQTITLPFSRCSFFGNVAGQRGSDIYIANVDTKGFYNESMLYRCCSDSGGIRIGVGNTDDLDSYLGFVTFF
jgi:predicted outer membrane repeat protein